MQRLTITHALPEFSAILDELRVVVEVGRCRRQLHASLDVGVDVTLTPGDRARSGWNRALDQAATNAVRKSGIAASKPVQHFAPAKKSFMGSHCDRSLGASRARETPNRTR